MKYKEIPLNERIIFALDVDSLTKCEKWLDTLGNHINFFKVGLELFVSEGFDAVNLVIERGHKVMVDLKFFDVPQTVGSAIKALSKHKITFATIHGNESIVKAAVSAKQNEMKLLAITVLTSFGQDDMKTMGINKSVEELVFDMAKRAVNLGCDGVVASGLEAHQLRTGLNDDFLIVTPGIRSITDTKINEDDQKRIMTAQQAIINGADHIVVGRPIRTAKDPLSIVCKMQEEIQKSIY